MPKKTAPTNDVFYRGLTEATAIVDKKRRLVRVSFSSEQPYERASFYEKPWIEVLGHGKDEVDLSRLNSGATVHYNHSRQRADRLGKVERACVENGRGIAEIRISKRADVSDIWDDLEDQLIANVSVGYRILEKELTMSGDNKVDEFRVTSWIPMEISIVDIPADHTVGVGRMFEYMSSSADRNITGPSGSTQLPGERKMPAKVTARDKFRREEKQRREDIVEVFRSAPTTDECRDLLDDCLADIDVSADGARKLLLDEIGRHKTPTGVGGFQPHEIAGVSAHRGRFSIDTSRSVTMNNNFAEALLHRRGIITGEMSDEVRALGNLSLRDIVRANLDMSGSYRPGMTQADEFKRFHTSDDLKNLLANVANKSLITGFENSELATHQEWTTSVDAPNFKPMKQVALSEIGDLELQGEGGELKYTTVKDTGVDIQVYRYELGIIYSREMYINDDLQQLLTTPHNFSRAALRLEKDLVFAGLTTNPVMGDGNPLFDATHNNVGTPTALNVASLSEAKTMMRLQMNLQGLAHLDIMPTYLIVPAALETTAETLINSIFDPDGTTSSAHNPFARKLKIIVEPRLDTVSSSAWYLVCSPSTFHWFSRVYLQGNSQPFLDGPVEDFDTSSLKFKVRHEFNAAPILWQGAVYNAGV